MKMLIMLGACIFLALQAVDCQVPTTRKVETRAQTSDKAWHPGNYRGLYVGRSTYTDMIRVLGKPKRSETPFVSLEVWYEYPEAGKFQSKIVVVVSKRNMTILSIDLYPENLSKNQATEYFGPDYIVTRYDFDECLGDEESGPMYESPTGEITFIEYRNRGIAIGVNYKGNVNEIRFVKGPIGATKSKCNLGKP